MHKNQKGFAVLETLLLLVIVAVVAGVGWYAIHTKNQTDKILSQADKISTNTAVKPKRSNSNSDNWNNFSDNIDGLSVSFSYPKEYTVTTSLDGEGSWRGFSVLDSSKNEIIGTRLILDQARYTGSGSSDDTFAWQTFKSKSIEAVAESNRQTSIKFLNSDQYISDKYVGNLVKIPLMSDAGWGYEVRGAYAEGYRDDIKSGALVYEPTIVFYLTNSDKTQVITGTYLLSNSSVSRILSSLDVN